MKIIGLSGSLRRHSYNSGLLRAAVAAMPEGATLEIATIRGIPLYDGDLEEAEGIPAAVTALKDAIAGTDGLLIATPEYNHGIPGVFKNALDWASRPPEDQARVFAGKPVALIGATPGGGGTLLGQTAWLPTLRWLGTDVWNGGKLIVSGATKAFDGEGNLTDPAITARLTRFLADFVALIGSR